MLKYELKKYILKPSLHICIIVLILLNFVKVFELYYYTGGGRAVLSGNAVQGTDILYDKYSGKITDEKKNDWKRIIRSKPEVFNMTIDGKSRECYYEGKNIICE